MKEKYPPWTEGDRQSDWIGDRNPRYEGWNSVGLERVVKRRK